MKEQTFSSQTCNSNITVLPVGPLSSQLFGSKPPVSAGRLCIATGFEKSVGTAGFELVFIDSKSSIAPPPPALAGTFEDEKSIRSAVVCVLPLRGLTSLLSPGPSNLRYKERLVGQPLFSL